jgi:hypothetical protein
MRRAAFTAACLASLWVLLTTPAQAQTFSFDLTLERDGEPNFNADPRIRGAAGTEALFTANMILSSAGIQGADGPQGWSTSLWHAGVELDSLSVEGTVTARQSEGGLVEDEVEGEKLSGGFVKYEAVDPARNGGREGVVQAVVFSFRRPLTLPPNTSQVIGRNTYRARVGPMGVIAFLRFEDDLIGSGQPVPNAVTFHGQTEFPLLGERLVVIGDGAVPETGRCDDGIDNDGDGWTDADDPECAGTGGEVCGDGADNDGDLLADCDDPDCQRRPACREVCTDGRDNDRDGLVDCADPECAGRDPCPPPEVCDDGADNDRDGRADCADSDCERHPACRIPEDCDDGADNDRDGRTDCADRECFGVGDCPAPEDCGDGFDNDRDGFTDCDDRDCASLLVCRESEDCNDGLDNDVDGRVDCNDFDCAGVAPCPPAEVCDNGFDEDGDGLVDCADPFCAAAPPCSSGGQAGEGFDLVLFANGAVREAAEGAGAGGPGIAEANVVDVSYASEALMEIVVYIVPFPGPQPEGVQGWSLSIRHPPQLMSVESATIAGTDAAEFFSGGFSKTEVADDPADGGGAGGDGDGDGIVSAVILSFSQPVTLDPTRPQSILRATYRLLDSLGALRAQSAGGDGGASPIAFDDGLRGSGQPVRNVLTVMGQTVTPVHFISLAIRRVPGNSFVRGDPNGDGRIDLADAVWSVNELVRGGRPSLCPRAADVNGDDRYDLSDPIFLASYLFRGGRPIPAPFPSCGTDGDTELACPEESVRYCP